MEITLIRPVWSRSRHPNHYTAKPPIYCCYSVTLLISLVHSVWHCTYRCEGSSDDGTRGVTSWEGLRHSGGLLSTTVSWRPRPLCKAATPSSGSTQHWTQVPELSVLASAVSGRGVISGVVYQSPTERHLLVIAECCHTGASIPRGEWHILSQLQLLLMGLLSC